MSGQLERIPPHSDDAEKSVLGAVLIDKDVFTEVSELIKANDFYSPAHAEIYNAMFELAQRGEPIDLVTVSEELTRRKSIEAVGGRVYLSVLSTFTPTSSNAEQYARIISEKSMLRKLIKAGSDFTEEAYLQEQESRTIIDHAEQSILDIAKSRGGRDLKYINTVMSANIEMIHELEKNHGQIPGLKTGFKDVDNITLGLQKSDLIIVAARPSMGKTAFALNIAQHAAVKEKKRVVIFSLEMSAEQLGMRFLAMEARVDSTRLRNGTISTDDWASINEASEKLANADIIIDDTPGIGSMEIRNKCRRIAAERPIDLIVIDYMQMMSADSKSESRQQEVTQISRYMKQLAREMECPVICLSQLSRAAEKRQGDARPVLSDLRESGAIEQDADVVMFLFRKDYYKGMDDKMDNKCELIFAKQRNGQTGSVTLTWLPAYTKFADYAGDMGDMTEADVL